MMHRKHFPSPSEGQAVGLWSLALPQWATPPSPAGERSATRSLRAGRRRPRGAGHPPVRDTRAREY